ncbi:uncharacterized protein TNCV_2924651 [Trichonephila clavipes]|nr:uncharacterized protein TNCV_2924651 [Trichonephila clavipes]
MPLRRRRSYYQQLTEFERGCVIGLREGGFSLLDIAERLGRNVSAVYDCWERTQRTLKGIDTLPWPARSPDLSPVETLMRYHWNTTPASSTVSTDRPRIDTTSATSLELPTTK